MLSTLCLFAVHVASANSGKVKELDRFNKIDPKTLVAYEAKITCVSTQDSLHPKVLDMSMDYAKPGGAPRIDKQFPVGTLGPKTAAIRFWVRSDSGTSFSAMLRGTYKRKDGRLTGFNAGSTIASPTWTQVTIPIEKLERQGAVVWRDGAQVIIKGGGAPDEDDLKGLTYFVFITGIGGRGSSTVGHLQFDGLELVER